MTEIEEILDKYSIPEPNSGCWIWTRSPRISNGRAYGMIVFEGRLRHATHLALETRGLKITKGTEACHKCDVTLCVNPNHLFVGTHKENMQDAKRKGRLVGYGVREFCKHGHPLSGDNVYITPSSGKRSCQICRWKRDKIYRWGRNYDIGQPPTRFQNDK